MSDQPTPYAISLVLHQDEKPGWRIHTSPTTAPEGHHVSIAEAEAFARAATDLTDVEAEVTPFAVVRNGTTQLRDSLERALAEAETKAATIPGLRRALGEME